MDYSKEAKFQMNAEVVRDALTSNIDRWWGRTDKSVSAVGEKFRVFFGKAYWEFVLSENTEERVVWDCTDGMPDFEREWIGTRVIWNIRAHTKHCILNMTHEGLVPSFECYDVCAPTWDMFLDGSLRRYLETGKGSPHD